MVTLPRSAARLGVRSQPSARLRLIIKPEGLLHRAHGSNLLPFLVGQFVWFVHVPGVYHTQGIVAGTRFRPRAPRVRSEDAATDGASRG